MQHDAIRTAKDSNNEIRTCGDYLDQQSRQFQFA